MKNFKKVLAVMTAVSAMAATTSAFAANEATVAGGVTGTYVANDAGAYKLTVATPAAAKTGEDITLLVLTEGALTDDLTTESVDESAVADSEILYIDQGIAGTDNFAGLGLKNEIINAVTTTGHIVKVGYYDADGEFAIAEGTIAVTAIEEDVKTVSMVYGNVNCDVDNFLNASDCTAILRANVDTGALYGASGDFAGFKMGQTYTTEDGQSFVYGNVNCDVDNFLNASDCTAILRANVDTDALYGASGDFTGFKMGQTYNVVIE